MSEPQTGSTKLGRIGRYEILSELGKGAMGVVYLAKDPAIGRLVAIKTIRPAEAGEDDSESREFRERFLREAQTAGVLSHPNIVTIYDVGEDVESGLSFIAMEYIDGKSLKTLMADRPAFPPENVADIAAQVAEALDYAHRKGIIHRDIKPANVMITTDGKVKITDFGIAKVASSNLTTTGQFLGTPNYMSPEQVTGAPVDGRSDIFSLGVVLYEMLSRRKPFSGENLTTISYKIVHEDFVPVTRVASATPAEFDPILTKALAKDPWNRYQRGKEMALALYQAKARFEEQALFQDLGALVSSAEHLPTLKLENLADLAARGDPTRGQTLTQETQKTVPMGGAPVVEALPPSPAPAPETAIGTGEPQPAPGAPEAGTVRRPTPPGRSSIWKAEVNPKYWWGIVAVVIVVLGGAAVGVWMMVPRVRESRAVAVESAAALSLRNDLRRGIALFDKGDYASSVPVLRSVLQRDPSTAQARDYLQKAEQALAAQQEAAQKQAQIAALLNAGRSALADKRFDDAIAQSDKVLDLDPQNADAQKLSQDARRELALSRREALRGGRRRGSVAARGAPARSGGAAPPAGEPVQRAPGAPAEPAAAALVHVSFESPIAKGLFMVAVNDTIVFRKSFDFGKAGHGAVTSSLQLAPGAATLKFWLTALDSGVKDYYALPVRLAPGDNRTASVTFSGKKLAVRLR